MTLDDATANPLTFIMPSASTTIKANLRKGLSLAINCPLKATERCLWTGSSVPTDI